MKKIVIFLFAFLVLSPILYAQEEEALRTEGRINGRGWRTLDSTQKFYYILGLVDGIRISSESNLTFEGDESIDQYSVDITLEGLNVLIFPNMTYVDSIAYLDDFYSDATNLNIPVTMAYGFMIAEKREWVDYVELKEHIKATQEQFNKEAE